jgi:ubiquitin-protein ligase
MDNSNKIRLARDIKDIMTNPLDNDGIYYKHDEDNISIGRALIIGPKDTPYQHGFYLFKFIFPQDYPYSPPKVLFDTGNNIVRFHPNLYKNRKVCISIINTWNGPKWSSCQTIRSVLLTLISILTTKPLLHEPGITENYSDFDNYTQCITYENLKIANYDYYYHFLNETYLGKYIIFKEIIVEYMKENINEIIEIINKLQNKNNVAKIITISIYGFTSKINYLSLYNNYIELKNKID